MDEESTLAPGALVGDRFELLSPAGEGGMAAVWKALDVRTGQPVALKIVISDKRELADRFAREAHTLAGLSHPHIVAYVDHGRTSTGAPFLAMEWIEGGDLADRLAREPLTLGQTVELGVAVASALGEAHVRGVVHRDVKPSNLLLRGGDPARVKVVDFGIARWAALPMTMAGQTLGTPGYMAPEQARGLPEIDARADVFALGCVLYECLTRVPAFVSEHLVGLLAKVLLEDAAPPSSVVDGLPPALDALVTRMLAKDPKDRPANGAAVASELVAIAEALRRSEEGKRPPAPSERPPALTEEERRLVCVVVAGKPAEVSGVLPTLRDGESASSYLAPIVTRYGGRLEQLGAGAYVALLSSYGSVGEHVARAARCALALQTALSDVPVALATGRAVFGGERFVGEAIERAARLLVETAHGRVSLDAVTAALLDASFIVTEGTLHGEREVRVPVRTVAGRAVPFIGRKRELTTIEVAARACVDDSQAQVVSVIGDAGVGKSRLLYEALRRMEGDESAPWIWRASGDPMIVSSPLGVLTRMLRSALALPDGAARDTAYGRLATHVAAVLGAEDAPRVTAFVGALLGLASGEDDPLLRAARKDARLMGEQITLACTDLLTAECAAGPTVIAIEDLHWCDSATLSVIDATLRRLSSRPLLVLTTARPESRARFPALFRGIPSVELPVSPFRASMATEMVRAVLGDAASEEEVARIVDRAGGNPFHLEELVRAAAAGEHVGTPETVLATVQTRIEALPAPARRALRAASVFGETFWTRAVEAVASADRTGDDVGALLDTLEQREIVSRSQPSRFDGEEEWRFRHTLVREAAYEMLTESDRRLAHRLAGRWLEEAGEADPLVIAQQLDWGDRPAEAIAWYVRAARAALEAGDFAAALAASERALDIGRAGDLDDAQRLALHLVRAEAHRWSGQYPDAVADARHALAIAEEGSEGWYRAVCWLGRLSQRTAFLPEIVDLAARIPHDASRPHAALALAELSVALVMAGRGEPAEPLLETLREAEWEHDPSVSSYAHRALGIAATSLYGDFVAHLEHMRASAAAFAQAGDRLAECTQRTNVGFAYAYLGLYDEAVEALRTAVAGSAALPESATVAVKNGLAMVLRERGDAEEALPIAREAMAIFEAQGDRRMQAVCGINLAKMLFDVGEIGAAESQIREAIAIAAVVPPVQCLAYATLSNILRHEGRLEEALEAATECYAMFERTEGMQLGEEAVRLAYAEALHATGDDARAKEILDVAVARLHQKAKAIPREALRESFLYTVRHHARIHELAREL